MASASKFFEEPKKTGKKTARKNTYSNNELKGIDVVRTADGKIDKKATYYSISVRLPKALEEPIKEIAWEKRTNVTDYIIELIKADLKKNKKL